MARLARVVFVLLVGATFAAFFAAQRLKAAPPVVEVTRVTKFFSPNGDKRRDDNQISLRLTEPDEVTLSVVDADGDEVRRLLANRPAKAWAPVRAMWNGETDAGRRAPDGAYRLRVRLRRQGRSVDVQRVIQLDTTPPRPRVRSVQPAVAAPGQVPVRIRLSGVSQRQATRVSVLRTDGARPVEVWRARWRGGRSRGVWDGRGAGPGTYLVQVAVEDRAGNVGVTPRLPLAPGRVPGRPGLTLRRLAVQPPVGPVRAGQRAEFFLDTRNRAYRWSLRRLGQSRLVARGRGLAGRPLRVSAPGGPSGVFLLQVRAGTDTARVPFAVQGAERAPLLVVLPALTWLGTQPVDTDGNGVPNTFARRAPVPYPRLFAPADALPAGFEAEVAPLLVALDRARLRYDLTTDLALASAREALRPEARSGVMLAGPLRWVPNPLARRLRRYVVAGGRVAAFGADSLRRGVTVEPGRLVRPTQPTALDPFGARLGGLVRLPAPPPPLVVLAEEGGLGLLTGSDGRLEGFRVLEEARPRPERRGARVLVALGREVSEAERERAQARGELAPESRPALTATRLGRGLVVRVGLPEWGRRLGEDAEVAQVHRNVVDLLRRVRPRVRSK